MLISRHFNEKSSDAHAVAAIREAISWEPTFREVNEVHHRILINYLSQLLLRPRYELGYTFFELLENLSFSFSTFLVETYKEDASKLFQASRVLTSLGYVHDKINDLRRATSSPPNTRRKVFIRAAQILQSLESTDRNHFAKVQYALGWQLLDAGEPDEAVAVFSNAAHHLFPSGNVTESGLLHTAYMLAFLAHALSRGKTSSPRVTAILQHFVARYGIVRSVAELESLLFGDLNTLDVGKKFFNQNAQVNIYSCRFDTFLSIMIASTLLFSWNIPCRLIVVHRKSDIDHFLAGEVSEHLILGAPDTPEGVGEWISSYNPNSQDLYQLKLHESFHSVETFQAGNQRITISGGCGVGDLAKAWNSASSLVRMSSERKSMYEMIVGSVLIPILKTAGDKVSSLLIEKLTAGLEAERRTDSSITKEDVQSIKRGLEDLQRELALRDSASPETVEKTLKLNDKSALVKTLFAEKLSDETIFPLIQSVVSELSRLELEPEDAWHLAAAMCSITQHLRQHSPAVSGATERELHHFQEAFLAHRSRFRSVADRWRIYKEVDSDLMNSTLSKFSGTVFEFFRFTPKIL